MPRKQGTHPGKGTDLIQRPDSSLPSFTLPPNTPLSQNMQSWKGGSHGSRSQKAGKVNYSSSVGNSIFKVRVSVNQLCKILRKQKSGKSSADSGVLVDLPRPPFNPLSQCHPLFRSLYFTRLPSFFVLIAIKINIKTFSSSRQVSSGGASSGL